MGGGEEVRSIQQRRTFSRHQTLTRCASEALDSIEKKRGVKAKKSWLVEQGKQKQSRVYDIMAPWVFT